MEKEKYVDESWKESALKEDKQKTSCGHESSCDCESKTDCSGNKSGEMQVDFISYITSLSFQAMIFLGLIPNPITNEMDKNIQQAKFIIDTLVMMREKTKGNLISREEELLNSSVYELQMRYVEEVNKESKK